MTAGRRATERPAPPASEAPGGTVGDSRTSESSPDHVDASAARTETREPNPYEANRDLFEELDRETKAASEAMDADDMDAWNTHAGRAAELHEEIAKRLGWRITPPRYNEETR